MLRLEDMTLVCKIQLKGMNPDIHTPLKGVHPDTH